MRNKIVVYIAAALCLLALAAFLLMPAMKALGGKTTADITTEKQVDLPVKFNADTAFVYCMKQCEFGPRIMNSVAHDNCEAWIAETFRNLGCEVSLQKADLKGYDGTTLKSTNIIARCNPEAKQRILLCAHWDSRPWADNDPNPDNHHTPVMAANDGASGVAVMLEIARQMQGNPFPNVGIDFVCFDAEDWGLPQWEDVESDGSDTWALGAQYWATHVTGTRPVVGILLDMVGGQGARFYKEQFSMAYAKSVVDAVWNAAGSAGYSSFFPNQEGGAITDDHVPVNRDARIPCIDIIPYYPDCQQSSFGPTWHTVNDTMDHIDRNTMLAVGQTLLYYLASLN